MFWLKVKVNADAKLCRLKTPVFLLKTWCNFEEKIKLSFSHQCQTSSKNTSFEDHYSTAHSPSKRRKNDSGLPQSVIPTKIPSDSARSVRHQASYSSDTGTVTRLDLGLELDMENIKDATNKDRSLIGDRERKFSDSSCSSPSTSVSSSPKVC